MARITITTDQDVVIEVIEVGLDWGFDETEISRAALVNEVIAALHRARFLDIHVIGNSSQEDV